MEEKRSTFEELCLPHLDAAYTLARLLVGRDQDAQDIVQEAYIRALKGFKGFRGGNARAWLLAIVRNAAYTWLKNRRWFLLTPRFTMERWAIQLASSLTKNACNNSTRH